MASWYMEWTKPLRKCSLDDLLMFSEKPEVKKEIMMRYQWWVKMEWKNFNIQNCIERVEKAYKTMTSEEWNKHWVYNTYKILDHDGWDRQNFQYSRYEEKITEKEFNKRLAESTIDILKM